MKRYVITHINENGYRVLTFANQGRNHYDTVGEAKTALQGYAPDLRAKILFDRADTLEVCVCECYDHGDAKGIYFTDADICV